IFDNVQVESSRTTDVRVRLIVGSVNEAVQVTAAVTPVLEMTSNIVSATITKAEMDALPLNGRDALDFARLVPGSLTPEGNGDTHFNGMPGGTINGTIDGINNASNGFKSGGTSFYATVTPRLGAMEEVTVESAGLGADAGAESGVNIKFVTRRGSSRYHGTLVDQARNDLFNANSYFNTSHRLPKAKVHRQQEGGSLGGPFPLGKLKQKLFFFVDYEVEPIPRADTYTNAVLTREAQQGVFRYRTASGEERTANLLEIAARSGYPSTIDPSIAALFAKQAQAYGAGRLSSNNDLRTE